MAKRIIVTPRMYKRVSKFSSYNHNVYSNGLDYIREQCDDDCNYYYYRVDCNNKEIQYLGVENFSIFDSEQDMVILNDYYDYDTKKKDILYQ